MTTPSVAIFNHGPADLGIPRRVKPSTDWYYVSSPKEPVRQSRLYRKEPCERRVSKGGCAVGPFRGAQDCDSLNHGPVLSSEATSAVGRQPRPTAGRPGHHRERTA